MKSKSIIIVDASQESATIVDAFTFYSINKVSLGSKDLITFEVATKFVGLKFYSEVEASQFHNVLIEAQQKSEVRRSMRDDTHKPKQAQFDEVSLVSQQSCLSHDSGIVADAHIENKDGAEKKKEKHPWHIGHFIEKRKEKKEKKKKAHENLSHTNSSLFYDDVYSSSSDSESQNTDADSMHSRTPSQRSTKSTTSIPPAHLHVQTSNSSPTLAAPSSNVYPPVQALRPIPRPVIVPPTQPPPVLHLGPPSFHPPPPPSVPPPEKTLPSPPPTAAKPSPQPPAKFRMLIQQPPLQPQATPAPAPKPVPSPPSPVKFRVEIHHSHTEPQIFPRPRPAPRPSVEKLQNRNSGEDPIVRAERAEKERDELAAKYAVLEKKYRKALTLLANANLHHGSQYEDALREFVLHACKISVQGLLAEFHEIRRITQPIGEKPKIAFDTNPDKNRYLDVYCVDESRVLLHGGDANYIHANWVDVPNEQRRYICTQGPMEATVADFWRMVWQEKCKSIVMLCNVIEMGVKKCEQYWPENVGQEITFGTLRIKTTAKEEFEGLMTVTTLKLTDNSNPFVQQSHEVKHILWSEWPDRGVPTDALVCIKLIEKIKTLSPTVIHCSAGIGRTGTIVALDLIMSSLRAGDFKTAKEIVIEFRSKRHGSVQTDIQYIYMHRVFIALGLSLEAVEESEVKGFIDAYEALCKQRGFM